MAEVEIEYELDQWQWQGSTKHLTLDAEEFEGMSDKEIENAVYSHVRKDGMQQVHFVIGDAVERVKNALAGIDIDDEE